MAESIKKNLFVIITLGLSIGILLYFLYTTDGITAMGEIILTLKLQWLLIAVGAAVLCWISEGFALNLLCIHLYPEWRDRKSVV